MKTPFRKKDFYGYVCNIMRPVLSMPIESTNRFDWNDCLYEMEDGSLTFCYYFWEEETINNLRIMRFLLRHKVANLELSREIGSGALDTGVKYIRVDFNLSIQFFRKKKIAQL